MESTAPPPPPPPPPGEAPYVPPSPSKPSGGRRALAVLLALVLAFAAAVMIAVMVDLGDRPRCDDTAAVVRAAASEHGRVKCFDVTSTQRTVTLVLGWIGGVLGAVAALLALAFAFTGRRGRLVVQLTALAVVLSALSILVGSL